MNRWFAVTIWIGLGALAAAAADASPPKFKIGTKRTDDMVEVRAEKEKTVFVVSSASGIGRATIERASETWPQSVVLRLKLKGLEHFRVVSGQLTIDAAVSTASGKPAVRVWKDGREDSPLDEKNAAWIDIRILNSAGTPAGQIPLKSGYFELALPPALFEGQPRTIALDWIDFYRS